MSSKETHLDGTVLPTPRAPAISEMKQPEQTTVNHHRLVNSESSYPDVTFTFDEDSKSTLEAHYAILKARAPALVAEAKQKKKGYTVLMGKGKSKPIPNHANALYRVLVYLYTGEVDWTTFNPFQGIEVLNLSKTFSLTHLAQISRKYVQDNIAQNNVYEVMKYAHRLEVEEVKQACIDFALNNTEFFTSNRAKELGFDLYQEATAILVKYYVKKANPSAAEKKPITAENTIVEDFVTVYNARTESGDLNFKLVSDKQVRVHKSMLSNLSNELDTLIRNNPSSVVPTRPHITDQQIIYPRLTADAFEAMLKFIYYSDKSFTLQHATQLYLFAKDYKLSALISTLDAVMNAADPDVQSVLFMLQIAYLELNDKKDLQTALKNKGLQFVVANLDKIDFKPLDGMPAIIGTAIVESVQGAVKKHHSNWDSMKSNFTKETRPLPTSTVSSYSLAVPAATATATSRATTNPPPPATSPPPPGPTARAKEDDESNNEETSISSTSKGTEKRPMRNQKKESKRPLAEEKEEGKEEEKKDTKKDAKEDTKKDTKKDTKQEKGKEKDEKPKADAKDDKKKKS